MSKINEMNKDNTDNPRNEDRRTMTRRDIVEDHGIVHVRVRPGQDVALVNVSAAGALVESAHQLRPGSLVEVHLSTAERRVAVRGRVLRCSVSRVWAACLWYRGAIGFEHHLAWFVDHRDRGYPVHTTELRPLRRGWGEASPAVL